MHSLLTEHPQVRGLVVAYSGGVDSHVLLHLLATHRDLLGGRTLVAVYVDHGLHAQSGDWGRYCEGVCHALGVDFELLRVNARPEAGESPEAAARRARYAVFEDRLQADEALLTAHQQDDQAETLLLQLLRGAGPRGLAAMPASAPLGKGRLLRPFLSRERADIMAYASARALVWIEDASNVDRRFDRNYLRHEILPLLRTRWPAVTRTLSRSARLCAESAQLLNELADADLGRAVAGENYLSIPVLREFGRSRLRNALRRWLKRLGLPVPSEAQLDRVLTDALDAASDREPCIRWPGAEIRRYRERLYARVPPLPHDPARIVPWPAGQQDLTIAGIGYLRLRPSRKGEEGIPLRLQPAVLSGKPLSVRFRHGGERLRLAGHAGSRSLKKLLQEAGVPPWERDRLPLLYAGEELAAVAGFWAASGFAARRDEEGLVLEWQKSVSSDNV